MVANDNSTSNTTDAFSTSVHGPLPPPMTARARRARGAVGVGQHAPRRPFNGAANAPKIP